MSNNAIKSERQEIVSEEDYLRAQLYEFLATLLRVEPTDAVVKQVANLSGDDTPIGQASSTLAHLAQKMDGTSVYETNTWTCLLVLAAVSFCPIALII